MFKFRTATFILALSAAAACGGATDGAVPTQSTLVSSTPDTASAEQPSSDPAPDIGAAESTVAVVRNDLEITGSQFVYGGLNITIEEAYLTNELHNGPSADEFVLKVVALAANPYDAEVSVTGTQLRLADSTTMEFNDVSVAASGTARVEMTVHEWLATSASAMGFDQDLDGAMDSFAGSTIVFGPSLEPFEIGLDGTRGVEAPTVSNVVDTSVIRDEGMEDPESGNLVEFAFSTITVSPDHVPWQPYFFWGQTRAEEGRRIVAVDAVITDVATTAGGSNVSNGNVRLVVDGQNVESLVGPNEISRGGNSFDATWLFDAPAEAATVELHIYQSRGDSRDAPTAILVLDPGVFTGEVANPVLEVRQLSNDVRIP